MLITDAVLETYEAAEFTLWPAGDRLLALSGDLSPLQVGTAMAVLTCYNKEHRERGDRVPEDGVGQLRRLASAASVNAPGGLRIRDTGTGVTVSPGCCCGLENWRDWLGVLEGEEPWFGHDPTPGVEHAGSLVRLWPDADRTSRPIEIPEAGFAGLLASVQQELAGFLSLVERWALQDFPPALAARVVARLAESLVEYT